MPKQRENNTKQKVKYISIYWAGVLTSTPALPVPQPLYLQRAQASWRCKTETQSRFCSANTCSSAKPCTEGSPRPLRPFLQPGHVPPVVLEGAHCGVVPGIMSLTSPNPLPLSHFPPWPHWAHCDQIRHNPRPCTPGDGEALAVCCFPQAQLLGQVWQPFLGECWANSPGSTTL